MDIAVVYNFNEHPGGGDLVALNIIETLVKSGQNIRLYTSYPKGLKKSVKYFLKDLEFTKKIEIKKINVLKLIKHPYNIYIITKKVLSELKQYDLIVFFDDIPKPAQELKKVLVYVHYPHAARILLGKLVPYRYKKTVRGRLTWKIHSTLFKKLFLINWDKQNIYVVANSTLTQKHVAEALEPRHLVKIYPPVQVEQITRYLERHQVEKNNEIIYVGRIQPEKGIDDIIKALALTRNKDIRASIMGFHLDDKYLRYLKTLTRELGVEKQVEFKVNAARNEVLQALVRARILVHPAHYEPFGIVVVEGMVAGCIPVVRKGFNGSWLDIVEKGRYGYGYSNVSELAETISRVITDKDININQEFFVKHARDFSEQKFKEQFEEIVKNVLY